ncbi:hypothetical protein S40293_10360 [Stachybotrys chartarum IBT 40293]|nr:hypothetical protein S40293_10360 [Stachybotrys chartarum IBT 40293]
MAKLSQLLLQNMWPSRTSKASQATGLDVLISQPVLWAFVLILIGIAGAVLGYGLDIEHQDSYRSDPAFYNLLWQTVLQILASYCSLVPVLRDRRQRIAKNKATVGVKALEDGVFYGCVALSIISAIFAPITYAQVPDQGGVTSSTIFNFAATVFAIIPATQLAGRIDELAYGRAARASAA